MGQMIQNPCDYFHDNCEVCTANSCPEKQTKPPVGLRPKEIAEKMFNSERIKEIIEAMSRYQKADKPIPETWSRELKERLTVMLGDDEAELKKKLSQANSNIVDLVYEMIGYMQGWVGLGNCPYAFNLAIGYKKPQECNDCETCKEEFWRDKTADLLTKYAVE